MRVRSSIPEGALTVIRLPSEQLHGFNEFYGADEAVYNFPDGQVAWYKEKTQKNKIVALKAVMQRKVSGRKL